jgi:hypothetical protein
VLKDTVLKAVATARRAFGDLLIDAKIVKREILKHIPGTTPRYPETEADVKIYMSRYSQKEIDGDRIKASDFRVIVFPVDSNSLLLPNEVPTVNDLIRVGDVQYRTMFSNNVMAGDQVAIAEVHMRLS